MEIKNRIIQYLKENGVLIEKIAFDTGISVKKLDETSKLNLSAEEFLIICSYLEVDPKKFNEKNKE